MAETNGELKNLENGVKGLKIPINKNDDDQYSDDFVSPKEAARLLEERRINDIDNDFISKRLDYISWKEAHMALALLISKRSKDPNTQVGAVIVDINNVHCGIGYNGLPRGCDDNKFPWGKNKSKDFTNKYAYVCHAEANAIDNCHPGKLKGSTIYTTLFPCNECAKKIVQVGIKKVIYNKYKLDTEHQLAAKAIFYHGNVEIEKFKTNLGSILLEF